MATKITIPVKTGILIPSDWQEQIQEGLKVSEIETPTISYFEFKRDSILEGGKNIFISKNKGKSWTKANGFMCEKMVKTRSEAINYMKSALEKQKQYLIDEIESSSVKLKKISQ